MGHLRVTANGTEQEQHTALWNNLTHFQLHLATILVLNSHSHSHSHILSLSLSLSLSNHEPLSFHQTLSLFPIKCLSLITPHHHHHQLPSLLCFTHSQTTASSSNPTCPYSPSCAVHFSVHPTRRLRRRSTYHLARRRSSRSRTRRRLRTRLRLRLPHAAKPHPTGVFFSLFRPLLCLVPNLVNYLVKEHKIFLCVFLRCKQTSIVSYYKNRRENYFLDGFTCE